MLLLLQRYYAFCFASEKLRSDKEFVLKILEINPTAFRYVSNELKSDKEIVLASLKEVSNLLFTSKDIRNDKEIAHAALDICTTSLVYLSDELKKDKEILAFATKKDSDSLKFISDYFVLKSPLIGKFRRSPFPDDILPDILSKEFGKLYEIIKDDNDLLEKLKTTEFIKDSQHNSSKEDHKPYKKVDDYIKEGDIVGTIESMMLINEIESEVSGKIVKFLVEDNSFIEMISPFIN